MAIILNIETTTTNCSVSIGNNGMLVDVMEDNNNSYSHSERLHVYIDTLLKRNGLTGNDIDAVAVSKGPGSYTGLRIGVSTAKGLCYAWDVVLIAVPTLSGLAQRVSVKKGLIVPMIDARRMEVYSAVFNATKEQIRETQAEILTATSFNSYLEKDTVTFIGSGVSKFKQICNHPRAQFIENQISSAKDMVGISFDNYKISNTEDVAYFEPYYLKEFFRS